jgi:hypothetical protein
VGNGVTAPFNSKPTQDNFHVDHARLGTHEEYDPTVPNEWGGTGKYVAVQNNVLSNALSTMGDIKARSSNVYEDGKTGDTAAGPCCVPSIGSPYGGRNPIFRKRG